VNRISKRYAKQSRDFHTRDYLNRLRALRSVNGDNQTEFAQRLGVAYKRWSNYERGYPMPRATCWILHDRLGVSIDWLWFGEETNMPRELLAKIHKAMAKLGEIAKAEEEVEHAKAKLARLRG
jgi:transcriptional regulator with XRE-family HTH domain